MNTVTIDAEEQWAPIEGYEGLYEVSSFGRVRSLPRRVARGSNYLPIPGGILKGGPLKADGRRKVELSQNNQTKTHTVPRLVALAFIPNNDPSKTQVLHRNGDNLDNRVENLYWGDYEDNVRDKIQHGTHHNTRKTHCPSGHEYDKGNTKIYRNMRYCLTCQRNYTRSGGGHEDNND